MLERAEKYLCVRYNRLFNVKKKIFSLEFGEVWYYQNVTNCFQQDCNEFLFIIKMRLV